MTELGYALSSEEHAPNDLICNAVRAEQAGFKFALISDQESFINFYQKEILPEFSL